MGGDGRDLFERVLGNPVLVLIYLPFLPFIVLAYLLPTRSYENEEEIVWVDWRGRERRIVIHRRARAAP